MWRVIMMTKENKKWSLKVAKSVGSWHRTKGSKGPWSLPDPVVVVSSLIHRSSVINQSGSKSPLTTAGTLIKKYSGITSLFWTLRIDHTSLPSIYSSSESPEREELSYYSLNGNKSLSPQTYYKCLDNR